MQKKNRFFGAVVLLETVSSMPSSLRPGVLDYGQPLWESDDLGRWADALERYEEAVAFKAARSPNKTTKGLKNLDKWVRDWRPSANGISADELQRCVEWKLKRGKFRPLMAQVASNSDAVVRGASAEAFTAAAARQTGGTGAAAIRRAALTALSEPLKGVGPATASAILARFDPDLFPFMADEAMEAVPGHGAREYSLSRYEKFAAALCKRAKQLQEQGSSSLSSSSAESSPPQWTAGAVSTALWSVAILGAEGAIPSEYSSVPTSASAATKGQSSGKRKRGA